MRKIYVPGLLLIFVALIILWRIMDFKTPLSEMRIMRTSIPSTTRQSTPPTDTLAPRVTATSGIPYTNTNEAPPLLLKESFRNCPVTLPNGEFPPGSSYYGINHGNEDETIFTLLTDDGIWVFEPHGPGEIFEDGSLAIKWPWFRMVTGDMMITGQRLDSKAPPMPEVILRGEEDGYSETGFHPSRLTFPSAGCWEVTARVKDANLSFVILVIRGD
jgi:hypothetical protein